MSVRGTVGKVGVVPAALAGANITANLIRMAPDRRLVTSTYLWHYMQTATFRMQLADACSSTTILTIRAPDLKRIDIPVPPLVLQGSYSNVAGVVQRLGAQHLAAAEQAAALFASLQEKAFGGSAALLAHPYGET
jgi:type I restriction enzyme S subunit